MEFRSLYSTIMLVAGIAIAITFAPPHHSIWVDVLIISLAILFFGLLWSGTLVGEYLETGLTWCLFALFVPLYPIYWLFKPLGRFLEKKEYQRTHGAWLAKRNAHRMRCGLPPLPDSPLE